jgi:predicted  nucleic acid-binding Zn-ribbon protein
MRLFLLLAVIATTTFAQDTTKKADAPSVPALKAEDKAAILEIKLRMAQKQNQYTALGQATCTDETNPNAPKVALRSLENEQQEIGRSYQADQSALQKAESDAAKNAGLDEKEWALNDGTMKFDRKAVPPPAVAQAAPGKTVEKKP